MPIFERGITTVAAGAGAAYIALRASANVPVELLELGLTVANAVNSEVGLVRAATGGTASTTWTPEKVNPASAAAATIVETAWSPAPTIAGTPLYLRTAYIGGTVGNGLIWVFTDPIIIPVSSSILIWNRGAGQGGILHAYAKWRE